MNVPEGKVVLSYAVHKGSHATAVRAEPEVCNSVDDARKKFNRAEERHKAAGFTTWFAEVRDHEGGMIAALVERNDPPRLSDR